MVMHELIKGGEATAASKPNNELSNVVVAAAEDALLFPHEDDIEAGLRNAPNTPQEKEEAPAAHGPRLVSLDVFRGFTVALMILVDYAGAFLPAINHSPWSGITLADVVMPFFLFIVGVALALTYKRVSSKAIATKKAVLRAMKLFIVGLIVQGGFFHGLHNLTYGVDILRIRWMGILQRIAVAYLLAAICEIWLKSDDDDSDVYSGYYLIRRYRFQLINSPASGPLPSDAPPWCQAPFDPEGLLRNAYEQGPVHIKLYMLHRWGCWDSLHWTICVG
ncbi:hypothetical protein OPV22_019725 [Ensete ventricosum]|uniref:Heparan-alpha-glucosaminide N-acetyltransferase catalytic domain-containing protein n=1 Tax=Ensete ventricosum TaxID=4639 RepID=A0AAV8QH19_ENSVE|nr:hypothetical protein OPV22_019725 [Ensete ventricosum]